MYKSQFEIIQHVSSIVAEWSNFCAEVCDFVACQFALESNFGISTLARNNNNYFGMKNPLVRISTAVHAGDSNYHWAQYNGLSACVIDYLLCLQYHRPLSTNYDTIEHFSKFLIKFYCPERDYIDKINLIYQQFKSYKNE